jgi:hypothetical protein
VTASVSAIQMQCCGLLRQALSKSLHSFWHATRQSCTMTSRVVWRPSEPVSAPADLDHTNQDVRESLTDWMSWLKSELGFMGWRFDFTKVCGIRHDWMSLLCNPTSR